MTPDETLRLFFALWPDADTRRALARAGRWLHKHWGGRRMAPETLHITLAFLGAVPAQRLPLLCDIAQAIQAEPFELTLDQAGCWGHNRVGWLGAQCVPTALADLAGRLADALSGAGFALDARAFTPHVTLLRRAQCTAPPAIVPIVWPVTAFALVASVTEANGARYRILAEWPLRSGSPAPGA